MQTAPTSSPDPLLETQLFWTRYRTAILLTLAALLLAVLAYGAVHLYQAQRDAAAARLLAEAKTAPDYQKVIAEYPKTGAAVSAYILLALDAQEKRQFAEAKAIWEKFLGAHTQHQFASTALMGIGANLESLGKTEEALAVYRNAATKYPQSYNAPLALLAQARLLEDAGKSGDARRVYETILTQFRESYASLEASQALQKLQPTPPPMPVPVQTPPATPAPATSPAEAATAASPVQSPAPAATASPAASPTTTAAP